MNAEDVLIILPVNNTVLFPGVVLPIAIAGNAALAAAQEAVRTQRRVGLLLQSEPSAEAPGAATPGSAALGLENLHRVGTAATIVRFVTAPDGTHHLIAQGEERFTVLDYVSREPFLVARIETHKEPTVFDREVEARGLSLRDRALEAVQLLPQAPGELVNAIRSIESFPALADMVASFMDLKTAEKQEILATFDLKTRLDRVLAYLARRIEVLKVSRQIDERTREAFDERQKEAVLRERLRQIQKELGETDTASAELDELKQAVKDAGMPPEAEEQAQRELKRLERMPDSAAEYSMIRTYLDWLIAMPWSKIDPESVDIEKARAILDEDHYGLEKVKRRILEFLAVRKLNPEGRSPILCFVGPPGVGKTSLGQSIAKAIGLKFGRVSLGGVHDEAEIRGHRRTYIGSLPGNIAQAVRKAGRRNPVLMLDEVDKLSASHQGDPFSALLEVLDPEQNNTFRDNYLAVPFDLSKVLFIGTANVLDSIPAPLRDRMEIIELTGYTEEEKLQIAGRYLLARQLKANGLASDQVEVSQEALRRLIADYTREAGVRNLERQIGAVLRSAAVTIASGGAQHVSIGIEEIPGILGAPRFESDVALRTSIPGVATGLAWTPAGGDISVHRIQPGAGQRQTHSDGTARRSHEGKRAGRGHMGEVPGRSLADRSQRAGQQRLAHSRAGRRHSEGRAECRRRHRHFADVAAHAAHGASRCRHDGRDQPAGRGDAGRRHQGEMCGCGARWNSDGNPAGAQSARPRGHSGQRARKTRVCLGGADRGCARACLGRAAGAAGSGLGASQRALKFALHHQMPSPSRSRMARPLLHR